MEFKEYIKLTYKKLLSDSKINDSNDIIKLREYSYEKYNLMGLPSLKSEEWKYTPINKFLKNNYLSNSFDKNEIKSFDLTKFIIPNYNSFKIVLFNGRFLPKYSSKIENSKLFICDLKKFFKKNNSQLIDKNKYKFDKYFSKILTHKNSLCLLNNALINSGLYICIEENYIVEKPIEIINFSSFVHPEFSQTRNLILLKKNSKAEILERNISLSDSVSGVINSVSEINLEENARINYYKIQNDKINSLIDSTFINQCKSSVSNFGTYSLDGKLVRNNLYFNLSGSLAESNLNAITLIDKKSHVDHFTKVNHNISNCTSNQLYKGIYDDKSRGVFNGNILVEKNAQKTNAFQKNNNILLSKYAKIDTKPQLEIFADDVSCSHGCTVGQLDEKALFYLKSRGIPTKEAKALLMFAFCKDSLKTVINIELRKYLLKIMSKKINVKLDLNEIIS